MLIVSWKGYGISLLPSLSSLAGRKVPGKAGKAEATMESV